MHKIGFQILTLTLFSTLLRGQVSYFNHLTTAEGLSQATNEYAYIDSRGLLWVSSLDGLNCFAGQKTKVYRPDPSDSTALLGSNIQSDFFEDKNGDIWFSTWEALHCYDRKKDNFKRYFLQSQATRQPITGYQVAWLDPDGGLWVILHELDLYRFDTKTKQFAFKISLISNCLRTLSITNRQGFLKMLLVCGENLYKVQTLNFLPNALFEKDSIQLTGQLYDWAVENDSTVWLSQAGSFGLFDLKNQQISTVFSAPNFPVNSLMEMPEKRFLMLGLGKKGIRYWDKTSNRLLEKFPDKGFPDSNFHKSIWWAKVDSQKTWMAHTRLEGIWFGNAYKSKFETLLAGKRIAVLAEDKFGHIWVGTRSGELFEFSMEKKLLAVISSKKKHPDSLAKIDHRDIFFDRENRGWLLAWNGLQVKQPNQNVFCQCQSSNGIYLSGIQLADGKLIFSTTKGGLFTAQHNPDATCGFEFKKIESINNDKAYTTLFQSSNGLLYACRELAGIAVFDPAQNFKEVNFLHILGEINHYFEDRKTGLLWFSTSNGLVKLDPKTNNFHLINEKRGLPNAYVQAAIQDNSGNFWLPTNGGLVQYFPAKDSFRLFSVADGLRNENFKTFSSLKTQQGEFWMGSMEGISIFQPEKMPQMPASFRPFIAQILINDGAITDLICQKSGATNPLEIQELELQPNQRTISFKFLMPEFGDPSRVFFLYRLIGLEERWIRATASETARYPNLPPGKYELQIRGFNSDAVESKETAWLKIEILPHFWQTWWFKLLLIIGLLSIGWLSVRNFYRRRERIRKLETDKILAVEQEQRRAAEFELRSLRAMINPHFFFNALNALNAYILKNEPWKASNYLGEFSTLMRKTLDNAAQQSIALADEIALIENYVGIENRRFEPPFQFKIEVDERVDIFETFVPSMILQPFVENAIWHGIQHLPAGTGILTLKIEKTAENQLVFRLQDNGIGRERAAEIRKKQGFGHRSRGMEITRERLEKLAAGNRVVFHDLKNEFGEAAGTCVEIFIKLDNFGG